MDEMKEERAEQKREAYEKLLVDEQRAAQARAPLPLKAMTGQIRQSG